MQTILTSGPIDDLGAPLPQIDIAAMLDRLTEVFEGAS